jgi:hypothetical protein
LLQDYDQHSQIQQRNGFCFICGSRGPFLHCVSQEPFTIALETCCLRIGNLVPLHQESHNFAQIYFFDGHEDVMVDMRMNYVLLNNRQGDEEISLDLLPLMI